MLLDLARVHRLTLRVKSRGDGVVETLIHVGKEKGGADTGLGVQARAPITVSTSSDLEVERAVHPVLLRSKDRSQVLSHRVKITLPQSRAERR